MATPCRASGGGVRDAEHERTRATWSPHERHSRQKSTQLLCRRLVCVCLPNEGKRQQLTRRQPQDDRSGLYEPWAVAQELID